MPDYFPKDRYRRLMLALVGFAGPCGALAQQPMSRAERFGEIQRDYPCVTSVPVTPRIEDPVLAAEGCWLVGAAIRQIALGKSDALGVIRADSARVTQAQVAAFHFRGIEGATDEAYWVVTLAIQGRKRRLAVYLWQFSRDIRVRDAGHAD